VAFWIHVTPRARREQVGGLLGDALRVVVCAPPVDGEANAACGRALARVLECKRGEVWLDPAARGRRKRVFVRGDAADLTRRLRALAVAGPGI
jgi:uncharacterized protein YggU (UPF0235/DUF167 family)